MHTGKQPYQCIQCDVNFLQKGYFDQHLKMHTGEISDQCGQYDEAISQNDHINLPSRPYVYRYFDEDLSLREDIVMHTKIHNGYKPRGLKQSDKTYKPYSLKTDPNTNTSIHTGEKPYQCSQCDKAFPNKDHLDQHLEMHNGEKPFHCGQCDRAFSIKFHLNQHLNCHHGEKLYPCGECEEIFSRKELLNQHSMKHSLWKVLYQCSQCDKNFLEKSDFEEHLSSHNGEEPYQYGQCGQVISLKSAYNSQNTAEVTREKTYKCNHCNEILSNKNNFIIHTKEHIKQGITNGNFSSIPDNKVTNT